MNLIILPSPRDPGKGFDLRINPPKKPFIDQPANLSLHYYVRLASTQFNRCYLTAYGVFMAPLIRTSPVSPPFVILAALAISLFACMPEDRFSPVEPARGPAEMIPIGEPITDGNFVGGEDPEIDARDVELPADGVIPDCGADCVAFCESQGFENPVHIGACPSLWGVGLQPAPINRVEACRRLHVDVKGRFPTRGEINRFCQDDRSWGEIVSDLLDSEEFVTVNRRKWADHFLYNTRALSVERIYDMDQLVTYLYQGLISYDHFAAVASAHPVLTRRHDTAGDRAEAFFHLFMGRPPLGNERSDIARLYNLWSNDYYDHPQLGMRLSDAHIRFRCIDEDGNIDPETRGQCTSVLYGYNELILSPDIRADRSTGMMWSGLLRAEEWEKLQLPGRILATQDAFWEHAVDQVVAQYFDYNLTIAIPEIRDELVRHLLTYDGDIRSVHHAILTSNLYLQRTTGLTPTDHRWTHGPLKQVDAEVWLDSMNHFLDLDLSPCDHRISNPEDFLSAGTVSAITLLENSHWRLNSDGSNVRRAYSNLARSLGGCPVNDVGGRFRIVSILTTANQLNFVNGTCNAELRPDAGVPIDRLLPSGMNPDLLVTPDVAEEIYRHQMAIFYGRRPSTQEVNEVREYGETCELNLCRAGEFARPTCFALLSSSEMLFY